VKDINTSSATASSNPDGFVNFAGRTFFSASDGVNGTELWVTDGTAGGTVLFKDIYPGSSSSFPGPFVPLGGLLLFEAADSTTGTGSGGELWASNGTAAGTVLVKDINPGSASSTPRDFAVLGGFAYFTASDGTNGAELWRSDGTLAGTTLFADINLTPGASSTPAGLVAINGRLWFRATDGVVGAEPWTSDGTPAGTVLVSDVRPGSAASSPANFNPVSGRVAFVADDGVAGRELWATDGTALGTQLVLDINPGTEQGPLDTGASFAAVGADLYFAASNGSTANGNELWITDGTAMNTRMVKDINPGTPGSTSSPMIAYGNGIVFAAQDSSGMELWRSDGTLSGTTRVLDINLLGNSAPNSFALFAGRVLFAATDGFAGNELWSTDGTGPNTAMVRDINPPLPANGSASPTSLTRYGDRLIFAANDGILGTELWSSDGTAAGTVLVKDIAPGSTGSTPANFHLVNGVLLFTALDGTNGSELWRTDGTRAGTFLVKDLNPGSGAGASSTASSFAVLDGLLFFSGNDGRGSEPARSDGTAAGTFVITDLNPGTAGSSPASLTAWNGRVYLQATNGTSGAELFATDGTAAGTVLVKDVRPGTASSSAASFTPAANVMFFTANEGTIAPETGTELWLTDGTPAGTVLVKDINPGTASSSPAQLAFINGALYFSATDGSNGTELWSSDGSLAGTTMLADLAPGAASSSPALLTPVNGKFLFRANDGTSGNELFVSDGTPAGTGLLRDIWPGATGGHASTSMVLASSGNRVLFCANDGSTGIELWRSDGTHAGTQAMFDLNPGSGNGVTGPTARVVGNRVFFQANDGIFGAELWSMPLRLYGGAVAETFGAGCAGTGGQVPSIAAASLPLTGSSFIVSASNGRPLSPCVLMLAGARSDLPAGACTLYPDLASSVFITLGTDVGGSVFAPLPLPSLPSLLGAQLWLQWAVADPAGQLLNLVSLTNGLYVVIGAP